MSSYRHLCLTYTRARLNSFSADRDDTDRSAGILGLTVRDALFTPFSVSQSSIWLLQTSPKPAIDHLASYRTFPTYIIRSRIRLSTWLYFSIFLLRWHKQIIKERDDIAQSFEHELAPKHLSRGQDDLDQRGLYVCIAKRWLACAISQPPELSILPLNRVSSLRIQF